MAFIFGASVFVTKVSQTCHSIASLLHSSNDVFNHEHEDQCTESKQLIKFDRRRRDLVASLGSLLPMSLSIQPSTAVNGFDDNQTPLFGLSQQIKRNAVRGAQVIDKIDGTWERFSDDFGLGTNRNVPKVDKLNKVVSGGSIGSIKSLNEKLASVLLQECDSVSIIIAL